MKRYKVTHITSYKYEAPVSLCHNEAHLTPRTLPHQECVESTIEISPVPAVCAEREDYFGNRSTYFSVQTPHKLLDVAARSEIVVRTPDVPNLDASDSWNNVRTRLKEDVGPDLFEARQFVLDSPLIMSNRPLMEYAKTSFTPGTPLLRATHSLMERIFEEFTYDPHFTTLSTPLKTVLKHRRGVCQDFAHLAIGCLRSLGLAARYVSGYLETLPPPGKPRLIGADASHAWFAVFLPDVGWVDYDPTNCQLPGMRYITLAWGRDYSDVTPLKGVILGGGKHVLKVSVDVAPIEEAPVENGAV